MDFYLVNALHWGVSRFEAKNRLLSAYCAEWASIVEGRRQIAHWPNVLDMIHPDARAEVLAYYGIIVGEE